LTVYMARDLLLLMANRLTSLKGMCGMRRFVAWTWAAVGCATALPAQAPQFDVVSIRRNDSGDLSSSFRIEPSGQLTVRNRTLLDTVRSAYDVQRDQIVRGRDLPDWFDSDRWDIVAKPPAGTTAPRQVLLMAQRLLADRFRLVARREQRDVPAFALTLAHEDGRVGPRLRTADGRCDAARAAAGGATPAGTPSATGEYCGTRSGPSHLSTRGVPMSQIARHLAVYSGRVVVDRTALSGTFDVDLQWTSDAPGSSGSAAGDRGSFFTAVREQLGLALEPSRTSVDALVVERADRPLEN
jgi:uncharacterized protein (TIGR03435 family)